MSKVKETVSTKIDHTKTVVTNIGEFLDAVAFTVVALFAVIAGLQHRQDNKWYWGLLAAGLLVSVQAFGLLVKHFSKKA